MTNNRVLINGANLHSGGGVQVAASFIAELVSMGALLSKFDIIVSDEVSSNLRSINIEVEEYQNIRVLNSFGLMAFFSAINKELSRYDLVFTIFGPNYLRNKGYIDCVGFAQSWILDGSAYRVLSPFNRVKNKIKFFAQKCFFKSSDFLVVELEHVMDSLYRQHIAQEGTVYVAHNCVSSLYLDIFRWKPVDIPIKTKNFRIGFLGRDYPHKNTAIIPQIKKVLLNSFGLHVDFYVTFNEFEWHEKSEEFKQSVNNVGNLSVAQCPCFYKSMDAVIFPSLLECFSATPLEAMVMEKPLFASSRRFVKDVCGDYAYYFDPFDPMDASRVIANYIRNYYGKDTLRLDHAKKHAIQFSSARERAERYLEIIEGILAGKDRKL